MTGVPEGNSTIVVGHHRDWWNGGSNTTAPQLCDVQTMRYCYFRSTGNRRRNGRWMSGSSFATAKEYTRRRSTGQLNVFRPGGGLAYVGSFSTKPTEYYGPALDDATMASQLKSLEEQGARFWDMIRPDEPDFSMAQSLGELKDVPSMLKQAVAGVRALVRDLPKDVKKRRANDKSIHSRTGEYFLALQFGWLPILSDIRKFVKAQRGLQRKFDQIIRDAGRPVRRRVKVPVVAEETLQPYESYHPSGTYTEPLLVSQCYSWDYVQQSIVWSTKSKTWASGQFRYFLPDGPRTVEWKKNIVRRIMGFRVTPSVVYELMPWSFLVDYFVDVGKFMSAVSGGVGDRLIADYFYLMRTMEWTSRRDASVCVQGSVYENANNVWARTSSESVRSIKLRIKGSPFKFGLRQEDLNPTQLAILAALGASRLP